MIERTTCLTQEEIKAFLNDVRNPSEEARAANFHLADCARCRQALQTEGMADVAQWETGIILYPRGTGLY